MNTIDRAIRRARHRLIFDQWLHATAVAVAIGLGCSAVLLILSRLLGWSTAPIVYAVFLLAGLGAACVYAWLRRPHTLAVAVQLDRHLGLKDRVGSVFGLQQARDRDDPFVALLVADAMRRLEGIDVRRATPIRISSMWFAVVALAATLGAGYVLIPQRQPAPPNEPPAVAGPALAPDERDQVREVIQASMRDLSDDDAGDPAIREQLDALEALAEQLNADDANARQARDASSARLNELSEQLARRAERERAALDELAERFRGLEQPDDMPMPMTAEQFAEALQRGDFGDAADQLEQLLNNPDQMTPAEREALARRMRQLADQLAASDTSRDREARRELLGDAMRDLGLNEESIEQLLDDTAPLPEDLERQLRNEGLDEETAAELSQTIREQRERDAAEQDAEQTARDLADLMDQTAGDLDPTPPDADDAADDPADASPDADDAATDDPADDPADPEADGGPADNQSSEEKPGENENETGSGQPDQQGKEQQTETEESGKTSGDEQGQQQKEQQSDADAPTTQEQRESEQPGERAEGDQKQAEQQQSEQQQSEQKQGEQQQEGGQDQQQQQQQGSDQKPGGAEQGGAERVQPDQAQQEQPGGQAGGDEQQDGSPQTAPGGSQQSDREGGSQQQSDASGASEPQDGQGQRDPSATEPSGESNDVAGDNAASDGAPASSGRSLAERLRDLERQSERADQRRAQSDRLRQRSRELLGDGDENERPDDAWSIDQPIASADDEDEPADLPRDMTPDRDTPRSIEPEAVEDIELDDDALGDQILARWVGDGGEPNEQATEAGNAIVERAQRSADRAVNDAAIPARYHDAIRRYFNRFRETVDRARESGEGGT